MHKTLLGKGYALARANGIGEHKIGFDLGRMVKRITSRYFAERSPATIAGNKSIDDGGNDVDRPCGALAFERARPHACRGIRNWR